MKVIKRDLPSFDELQILPLADLHMGDLSSNGKQIQEWIDYIHSHENCYTILNGDLMDTAIKTSIGDTYASNLTPMQQLNYSVKLFNVIKHKVLAVTPGNHEARVYKTDGLDTTQLMCDQLGIGDLYSPASALVFVRFGVAKKQTYSLYCVHGSGGGRQEGGKVNRLLQLASIIDADCYIHSHTHLPAIVKNSFFRTNPTTCTITKADKLFVNTSAALDYGGYGEVQSYKPTSLDTPLIILDGHRRNLKAVL